MTEEDRGILQHERDCRDAHRIDKLRDAIRLLGPAENLFREARVVLERPFGE